MQNSSLPDLKSIENSNQPSVERDPIMKLIGLASGLIMQNEQKKMHKIVSVEKLRRKPSK